MRAIVVERRPLLYEDGPDSALDRPAHVRAASAVVRMGDGLVVVQDDALWLAWVRGPRVDAIPLPAGPDGVRLFEPARRNKHLKPDFEAAFALDGAIVALGSGSTRVRQRAAVLRWPPETPPILAELPGLYDALRRALPDAALNLEGAFPLGDTLRLLQRGNGEGAVDATLDLPLAWVRGALAGARDLPPEPVVTRWTLGALGGTRLSFTDGAASAAGWWFLAAAEDSPDTYDDGAVAGSVLGHVGATVEMATLEDAAGQPVVVKAEGIAVGDRPDRLWVVVDGDDPQLPAELLTVEVRA